MCLEPDEHFPLEHMCVVINRFFQLFWGPFVLTSFAKANAKSLLEYSSSCSCGFDNGNTAFLAVGACKKTI